MSFVIASRVTLVISGSPTISRAGTQIYESGAYLLSSSEICQDNATAAKQ